MASQCSTTFPSANQKMSATAPPRAVPLGVASVPAPRDQNGGLGAPLIAATGALAARRLHHGKLPPGRAVTAGYIQFFRNTPPLVQLYFFYFALGSYLRMTNAAGLEVPIVTNFAWAAICLSLYAGAFNVEIFRAGIEAVPRETVEAAEALGYSRLRAYLHVILPLAFRISLPALNNNLVNLVKTTTIAYAIAVPEMLYVANQIWSDELNVTEMMNVLLVIYVALVGVVVYVMGRWERAMRIPGYTP
jgi:polar amino acid transport system permease protein